jgi:hypothetical protein
MKDWNEAYAAGVDIRAYADQQWKAQQEQTKAKANGAHKPTCSVPNLETWAAREITPDDLLLGDFISTTSRILITGPTGLGKTMLGIAMAFAIAAGVAFLHWRAGRPARVLYVDGEMSRREMQRRLNEEAARMGMRPPNLYVLSREDFEEMLPLNTAEGQAWMDGKIAEVRPDFIWLDNIQALIVGDNSKEESWAPVIPWVRSLTKRRIGQAWFHHTGHNEGHAYGTKTREWQLDACILLERVADADDLTFTIKFTKARARRPENRDDFADTTIRLRNNKWEITSGGAQKKKPAKSVQVAFNLLKRAIDEVGEQPPVGDNAPAGVKAVKVSTWQRYCETGMISKSDSTDAFRMAFKRAGETLQAAGLITYWADWAWIS